MICPDCGKKVTSPLWIKVLLPILILALIAATYFISPTVSGTLAPATPSPSPEPTPMPTPKPTPKPTSYSYTHYGLTKRIYYSDFIEYYNLNIEWYLGQRTATVLDLSLDDHSKAAKEKGVGTYFTDRQILTPNMSLSIFTADYKAYFAEAVYIHDHRGDTEDFEEAADVIYAIICTVDSGNFGDIIKELDMPNTILYERSRSTTVNGITYRLENKADRIWFKISLFADQE